MTNESIGDTSAPSAFPTLLDGRWAGRGLEKATSSLKAEELCAEYARMRANAPRRSHAGKSYFVGHTGVTSSTGASNRLEEHYAIALLHLRQRWPRPAGGWFEILDYQVPLKARQSDARVGKIDLLAITDRGRLMIIELKVRSQSGGRSDSPLAALMEGLRYAAMVEGDFRGLADEISTKLLLAVADEPPIVAVLAPQNWWRAWLDFAAAGAWGPPMARLSEQVESQIGVSLEYLALQDTTVTYGLNGKPPALALQPSLHSVRLGEPLVIGPALCDRSLSAD